MKYVGRFCSVLDRKKYYVNIITNGYSATTREITLAGNEPFVLTYEQSDNPFFGVRTSTAQISIVSDEYLLDMFGLYPDSTWVELWEEGTTDILRWSGCLQNYSNNIGYNDCLETITLNANDWLTVASFKRYTPVNGKKSIVSFQDIIRHYIDDCHFISGYRVGLSKYVNGDSNPSDLDTYMVSEQNFYSSDTDEAWLWSEVFEELSKYLGYTVFQMDSFICFYDNCYLRSSANDGFRVKINYKSGGSWTARTISDITRKDIESASDIRGTGNNMSYNTIYKKATLSDSFYDVDELVPNMFNEGHLTPRSGMKPWESINLNIDALSRVSTYMAKSEKKTDHLTYDEYYKKVYDNDYYSSVYYNWDMSLMPTEPGNENLHKAVGATLIDFAVAKDQHNLFTGETVDANYEIASDISFKKYLMIAQLEHPNPNRTDYYPPTTQFHTPKTIYNTFKPVFKLNSGYTNPIIFGDGTYAVIDCKAIWERNWKQDEHNVPSGSTGYSLSARYDYMDNERINKKDVDSTVYQDNTTYWPPYLIFTFGFKNGNVEKYWYDYTTGEGTSKIHHTGWSGEPVSFIVKMSQNTDEGKPTYDNWNTEFSVLNNVDWAQWVGTSGYKIPLSGIDTNGEIIFSVNLPSKLEKYTENGALLAPGYKYTNGENGYCWLSDLKVVASCEGNNIAKSYDQLYEAYSGRTIDDNVVDEFPSIQLKMTTCPDVQRLSYSNIGVNGGGYLETIKEQTMSTAQKPEENLLEKIVQQYSTQTISEELIVGIDVHPLAKVVDYWWDSTNGKAFYTMGSRYDYGMGQATISLLEIK